MAVSNLQSSPAMISRWHVCFGGFLQREGKPTGIVQLWQDLYHRYQHRTGSRIEMRYWHESADDLAEWIWLNRPKSHAPRINLYGYSWGGAKALETAAALQTRGLAVERMILSDAVYRHRYWLGQWRALWPGTRLTIPTNVRRAYAFRQNVSRPCGHRLDYDANCTTLVDHADYRVSHTYMDDLNDFHKSVAVAAASIEERQ